MQPQSFALGVVAAILGISACQPKSGELSDQDKTALRAIFDSTVTRASGGQWDAWAAEYSEDGILYPPNAPAVKGRAALAAWGKAFPLIEKLNFSDVQVGGEGNLAWGTSSYVLKAKDLPPDTGKQLVVFHRTASGKWEVEAASFNSDLPPPVPAASPKP